jgi:hypothetical protein
MDIGKVFVQLVLNEINGNQNLKESKKESVMLSRSLLRPNFTSIQSDRDSEFKNILGTLNADISFDIPNNEVVGKSRLSHFLMTGNFNRISTSVQDSRISGSYRDIEAPPGWRQTLKLKMTSILQKVVKGGRLVVGGLQ